jgi:hypothetical protein
VSTDVRDAIRRQYRRFIARRSANSIRRNGYGNRSSKFLNGNYRLSTAGGGVNGGLQGDQQNSGAFAPPIYFRSKFKTHNNDASRSGNSKSPSPETIANILPRSETPSPVATSILVAGSVGNHRNNVPTPAVVLTSLVNNKSHLSENHNRYEVNIPMKDLNNFNNITSK